MFYSKAKKISVDAQGRKEGHEGEKKCAGA